MGKLKGNGWKGGREGLNEREGKRRKRRREGERNLDSPMFQTDQRHCSLASFLSYSYDTLT
jgi:hypothetical protein